MLSAYQSGWEDGVIAEDSRVFTESFSKSAAFASEVSKIAYRKIDDHYVALRAEPKFFRTFGYYSAAITDFYTSRSAAVGAGLR
jgi:hypothetical protein